MKRIIIATYTAAVLFCGCHVKSFRSRPITKLIEQQSRKGSFSQPYTNLRPIHGLHPERQDFDLFTNERRQQEKDHLIQHTKDPRTGVSRRKALASSFGFFVAATLMPTKPASADLKSTYNTLEGLNLGTAKWVPEIEAQSTKSRVSQIIPASFATYASRILLNYDESAMTWWKEIKDQSRFMSEEEQRDFLGKKFGALAYSVSSACESFVDARSSAFSGEEISLAFRELANTFWTNYGTKDDTKSEVARHLGMLFSLLPQSHQPLDIMAEWYDLASVQSNKILSSDEQYLTTAFTEGEDQLLPPTYSFEFEQTQKAYRVVPQISFWEIGIGNEKSSTEAVGTLFGPMAASPLTRQRPDFGLNIYALLGLSGGVGCALTHAVVIPLDVVKTRMQTDTSAQYKNMLDGAVTIAREEGNAALFLGAQATIAGYLWYGVSVYPSYTFFKKFISESLLDPALAIVQPNNISLLAGALASVVASIGLTPIEACRIRTVADPDQYRQLGLVGTANLIANEDQSLKWLTLFGGFNSLVTRQVIFGSVKFLAFEQTCDLIYGLAPTLRDSVPTSLFVSLVAGGFSGALSSIVSQPADSVLTYVAQRGEGLGVLRGCQVMIENEGWQSLFRGLQSRCIWAGSIIAGQFLLYDIFRSIFRVSAEDLSETFQVIISSQ